MEQGNCNNNQNSANKIIKLKIVAVVSKLPICNVTGPAGATGANQIIGMVIVSTTS